MRTQEQVNEIVRLLLAEYPEAVCSLDWGKDYELLFSVRLSAQCTDERVNQVTPALFEKVTSARVIREGFAACYRDPRGKEIHNFCHPSDHFPVFVTIKP